MYLVSKMEKIDYMLVKLLCLVLLSIWNCNGNITTCNESVESKVCFLVNKVKNLGFSPLSDSQIVGLESNWDNKGPSLYYVSKGTGWVGSEKWEFLLMFSTIEQKHFRQIW